MATSDKIQNEINSLVAAQALNSEQLDSKIKEFGQELPPQAKAFIESLVQNHIERYADNFNALGLEGARQLKGEVAALLEQLPAICNDAVSIERMWPHKLVAAEPSNYGYNFGENYFKEVFRKVISNIGKVLNNYGLLGPLNREGQWRKAGDNSFELQYGMEFNKNNFGTYKDYAELLSSFRGRLNKIATSTNELAKAKAKELWGQA